MPFEGIGSMISAAASIGTGIANTVMQQQNLDYQKQLQQQMFNREDNAVQRRVLDLERAGLSPVLAAGSAAQAGPVIQTNAPKVDDIGLSMLAVLKGQADISKTLAEQKNIEMQTLSAGTKNLIDLHDLDVLRNNPQMFSRYGSSDIQTLVRGVSNLIGGPKGAYDAMGSIRDQVKSFTSDVKKIQSSRQQKGAENMQRLRNFLGKDIILDKILPGKRHSGVD